MLLQTNMKSSRRISLIQLHLLWMGQKILLIISMRWIYFLTGEIFFQAADFPYPLIFYLLAYTVVWHAPPSGIKYDQSITTGKRKFCVNFITIIIDIWLHVWFRVVDELAFRLTLYQIAITLIKQQLIPFLPPVAIGIFFSWP